MSQCTGNFPDMSSQDPTKNYRYFNQPIEQIPGWDKGKSQILFHGANRGLFWQNASECVDVVTCIRLTEDELVIDSKKIFVLKIDEPEPSCSPIPVTSCS